MAQTSTDVFKAISDPNRRHILQLLAQQTLTINSLVENFRMSRPAVSRHIRILHASGLITIEDFGRERHCRLKQDGFAEIQQWVSFYDAFWKIKLKKLKTC
jgi:DNA-binding transcriptional ArsR family regulator